MTLGEELVVEIKSRKSGRYPVSYKQFQDLKKIESMEKVIGYLNSEKFIIHESVENIEDIVDCIYLHKDKKTTNLIKVCIFIMLGFAILDLIIYQDLKAILDDLFIPVLLLLMVYKIFPKDSYKRTKNKSLLQYYK